VIKIVAINIFEKSTKKMSKTEAYKN